MITLYTANTPNGVKVTIAMEEMEQAYRLKKISLSDNEQKTPDFLAINPNGRIPAITDDVDGQTIRVFESGSALLYLAEKFGKLLPADPAERIEAISWTYFQTGGIGPMMGQAGWFKRNHPEFEPGVTRYIEESERLVSVMERRLTGRNFLAGDDLSIADIMHIGWLRIAPDYLGLDLSKFPAVAEWRERLLARPGVRKGLAVLAN